ncbi:hypothetical protein ACGC1H_002342 [Rhizoctonia solani]
MNKLEQILRGFVSFTELASSSGFLPALPGACLVLEQIWGTVDRVKGNKERCKVLRARCVYIFITIRDNAAGVEESALDQTVQAFITTRDSFLDAQVGRMGIAQEFCEK